MRVSTILFAILSARRRSLLTDRGVNPSDSVDVATVASFASFLCSATRDASRLSRRRSRRASRASATPAETGARDNELASSAASSRTESTRASARAATRFCRRASRALNTASSASSASRARARRSFRVGTSSPSRPCRSSCARANASSRRPFCRLLRRSRAPRAASSSYASSSTPRARPPSVARVPAAAVVNPPSATAVDGETPYATIVMMIANVAVLAMVSQRYERRRHADDRGDEAPTPFDAATSTSRSVVVGANAPPSPREGVARSAARSPDDISALGARPGTAQIGRASTTRARLRSNMARRWAIAPAVARHTSTRGRRRCRGATGAERDIGSAPRVRTSECARAWTARRVGARVNTLRYGARRWRRERIARAVDGR